MNILLQNKFDEIESSRDYETWYLVKQEAAFWKQCYYASIVEKYSLVNSAENFETFFNTQVDNLNNENHLELSRNHRAVRVGYFYGLITDPNYKFRSYKDAVVTETYREINNLCNGRFEDVDTYKHIIRRQLEKFYISSLIDSEHDRIRERFEIYPVLYLYKILVELGISEDQYEISEKEYTYFVSTASNFNDYLDTLNLILISRSEPDSINHFSRFDSKLDSRFNLVINQLETIDYRNGKIKLKDEYIHEITNYIKNLTDIPYSSNEYISFLGSTNSVNNAFGLNPATSRLDSSNTPIQKIFFGPPGSGKSYQADKLIGNTDKEYIFSTTIYPEFEYHDFIGSVMPVVKNKDGNNVIEYDFNPGIFTLALIKSIEEPEEQVYLKIEEMSRGNIAAIFGDVFQLLDRNIHGQSEYEISHPTIIKYFDDNNIGSTDTIIQSNKIYIPSNLNIIGTVNTSDQNVFVMDTAFKRRFDFEYVDIEPINERNNYSFELSGDIFSWNSFYPQLNKYIVEHLNLPEDKQLGQFFINFDKYKTEEQKFSQIYNKLLLYLWEDVHEASLETSLLFTRNGKETKVFSDAFKKLKNHINIFNEYILPDESLENNDSTLDEESNINDLLPDEN